MATINEALGRAHVQYEVKIYVRNNSGTYVDFTSHFTGKLLGLDTISHQAEGPYGQPVTASLKLTLDNSDRYWSKAAPAGSTGYAPWAGRYVQVRLKVAEVAAEANLATFRIAPNGIQTDLSSEATIQLEPLTETLDRIDAEEIKQGQNWYQFRPWTFLVEELIRTEFGDITAGGVLPASYEIPSDARVTFPDGSKHLSAWGKPPQWDGTSWNADNVELPLALDYDATGGLLYVGIGADLWEFNPATDTWTNRGHDTTIGPTATVRRVIVLANANRDVVVCKWDDDPIARTCSMHVTYFRADSNTWDTSARSTRTDFFSGQFWWFNGELGSAPTFDATRFKGRYTGQPHGLNLIVPFQQQLSHPDTAQSIVYKRLASNTADAGAEGQTMLNVLPKNSILDITTYLALRRFDTNPFSLRIAMGNKPNIAGDPSPTGGFDCILWYVRRDAGDSKYYVGYLEITRGAAITQTDVTAGGRTPSIHSLTINCANVDPYLAWIEFTEGNDSNVNTTTLYEYTVLSPVSVVSNANLELTSDMLVDILYFDPNTDDFVVEVMKNSRAGKFPLYQIIHWDDGTNVRTVLDSSMSYFQSQPRAIVGLPVFYVDTAAGSLKKLATGTVSDVPVLIDGGRPAVFDAPYMSDVWYGSGSDPDMWGLSRPFHDPQTQDSVPEGKYFLWSYATKHSGRVELADFSDLTKLAAISALCEAFRQTGFVDRDGDWVVKAYAPTTASEGTIKKDHLHVRGWIDLAPLKPTDIVNYVAITPTEARLEEMKTTIVQKAGSPFDGSVRGQQLDTARRSVRMRCVAGGLISSGNTRWDLRLIQETIRTRLAAAYTSGTTLTIESVWDVEKGDILQLSNGGQRTITAINVTTRQVTIDSGYSSAYPVLSPIQITRPTSQLWTSSGVTTLAEDLTSSETDVDVASAIEIAVGNFLIVGQEEMEVVDKQGNTLTVVRGDNNVAHTTGDKVAMIVKPADLDKWTKVGNTGIQVWFETNGNTETAVAVGDYIEFVCAGLVLEEIDQSPVIAGDDDSIREQGKRELKASRSNRFLTPVLADFWARDRVARGKTSKRKFSVPCAMDLSYFLNSIVTLHSTDLLPDDAGNDIDVIVRRVSYTPLRKGAQTVYEVEER